MTRRRILLAAGLLCGVWALFAASSAFPLNPVTGLLQTARADSPVTSRSLLVAPEFNDVSAFGADERAAIDAWLQEQVKLADYPSLSVAIVREGKTIYRGAFGFRDVKARMKATPETSYHVASVTKVFVTLLAVKLHERGVVNLDQPVTRYLPPKVQISTKSQLGAAITLRQLASHTSGLPRGVSGPVQSIEGHYQLEPRLLYSELAKAELLFDPGTDERYSNLGLGLLGHALERAAGKPLAELLEQTVCEPLGLERTGITQKQHFQMATGYGFFVPRTPQTHSYRERLAASGGLITSVDDLAQFLAAHMKPGVLSDEILNQLLTPTKLSDGTDARTGLGWTVRRRASVGRILKKNGGRNTASAWIGFAPTHGVGVVVVTNCGEPNVDPIGYWLLERCAEGIKPDLLDRKPVLQYEYARVGPFTGVRWENNLPVVRVQDRWSEVTTIDGLPIKRIVDHASREFGPMARKRFGEDLVEVLSTMGHDPKWTVTLGLRNLAGEVETVKVQMTAKNRDMVRDGD